MNVYTNWICIITQIMATEFNNVFGPDADEVVEAMSPGGPPLSPSALVASGSGAAPVTAAPHAVTTTTSSRSGAATSSLVAATPRTVTTTATTQTSKMMIMKNYVTVVDNIWSSPIDYVPSPKPGEKRVSITLICK